MWGVATGLRYLRPGNPRRRSTNRARPTEAQCKPVRPGEPRSGVAFVCCIHDPSILAVARYIFLQTAPAACGSLREPNGATNISTVKQSRRPQMGRLQRVTDLDRQGQRTPKGSPASATSRLIGVAFRSPLTLLRSVYYRVCRSLASNPQGEVIVSIEFGRIYFDTEPLTQSQWPQVSTALGNVLALAGAFGVQLVVPQPVLEERQEQWVRNLDDKVQDLVRAHRKLEKSCQGFCDLPKLSDLERAKALESYRARSDAALREHGIATAVHTSRATQDLFRLAVKRVPPFDENGMGFKRCRDSALGYRSRDR